MAAMVGAGPGAGPWPDDSAGVAGGSLPTPPGLPPQPQCLEAATQLMRNANRTTKSGPFSFRIRKGTACVEAGTKKGPMVAKHPPLASASLPTTPVSADYNTEFLVQEAKLVAPSSRCRTPPMRRCRTPPAVPGPDMGEGIRPRRRSPSVTRSRPSSPGGGSGGSGRRVPSPCSLDPAVLEAVRRRVSRIAQARLYLLSQPGPNSFVVGGDSPDHKYRVTIGPQTCSCGRGPHCLHLLFVMLRVFQVPESDSRIYLRELKNFEVESLFQTFQERRNSRTACSRPENCRKSSSVRRTATGPLPGSAADGRSSTEAAFTAQTNNAVEEDLCPICLLEMVDGESLVSCATGCRNKLHHHCMAIWAVECDHQGELVLCPLCRRPWQEETAPARSILSNPATIPFNPHTVPSNSPSDSTRRQIPSSPHATPKLRSPSASQLPSFPGSVPRQSHGRHTPAGQPLSFASKTAGQPPPQQQPPLTPKAAKKPHPPSAGRAAEHKPGVEFRRYGTPSPGSSSPMLSFRPFPSAHKAVHSTSGNSYPGQDVPVPHSGSIPAEQMLIAGEWIKVFGLDVTSCLYSRDWKAREWALRQLVAQLVAVHQHDGEEQQRTVVRCCAKILTGVAADPVFKVYAGCVRGCRVVLSYASRHSGIPELREVIRRIVRILLVKCADRNRRTSQLTTEVLVEFARGENGEPAAAGRNALAMSTSNQATFLDGVELVLGCVLEDWCYESTSWQWLAGRLVVLDRLVRDLPNEFALQYVQLRAGDSSGYKLRNYDRLISVVEFALRALHSTHGTVSKLARHVFVVSASMASTETGVLAQVVGMLAGLEPALQARLKKRLQAATDGGGQGAASLPPAAVAASSPLAARHKTVRAAAVATLNQPGITERRYSSKAEAPRPHCSACGHAKTGPAHAARSPPGSPALRPRDLALDLSYPRSKTPVKFQHLPGINAAPQPPAKRWSTSSSRLYNLFTRNKKLEEVLPSRPDPCLVPAKFGDSVETSSTCSFSAPSSPVEAPGSGLTTPGQESLADYLEDFAEELIIPLNVDELNWDLPPVPGPQGTDELQQTDINSQEQNMESGLKSSMYSEGKNWKRGHLLGTGAFSTCYQARDVTTGTLMAVKQVGFCRPAAKDQALVETGIREEIVTMRRLRHANVVRLLGATKQGGYFNVFVEWMAGGSVAAMLERYGPFEGGIIVAYTKQILDGLAYLHDNHVLHRDLKGANLLVDGTGRHLRIGDFGSSAWLASHATATGEFQNKVFGTTAFMAPEVLRGESYGRSCDVWSVGCCMIEMASSKPPWKEKCVSNHYALMYKIASSEDPPFIPNTLDWATKDLALHCLRLNSELRPSAKELLRHICFQGM